MEVSSQPPQIQPPQGAPLRPRPEREIHTPTHPNQLDTVDLSTSHIEARGLAKTLAFQGHNQSLWELTDSNLFLEQGKPDARMAVLDQFGMIFTAEGLRPGHGEQTYPLALQASGLEESDILRVDNSHQTGPGLPHPMDPNFGDLLDSYIPASYAAFAETTADNLEAIHESHPSVTTVSHSQGIGAASLSSDLYLQARRDPQFAESLTQHLGLEPDAFGQATGPHQPEAAAAVAQYVQDRLIESPDVDRGVDRLSQTLDDLEGQVRYFNSAGNSGQFQDLAALGGFEFEPRFQGSVQNEVTLTESIGSAVPIIFPDGSVRAVAEQYSQNAPVDASAFGTAMFRFDPDGAGNLAPIDYPSQGTSFAAPIAAGIYAYDPQAYQNLQRNSIAPANGETNLGVGLLDIDISG